MARKHSLNTLNTVAKRYRSRYLFGKSKDRKYYVAACRYGVMDKICGHMDVESCPYTNKFVYTIKEDRKIYVGLTSNPERRFREHHVLGEFAKPEFKTTKKSYLAERAVRLEQSLIAAYRNKGFEVINKTSGGELGSRLKYSKYHLMNLVKNCSSWRAFRKKYPLQYKAAQMRNLLPELRGLCSEL